MSLVQNSKDLKDVNTASIDDFSIAFWINNVENTTYNAYIAFNIDDLSKYKECLQRHAYIDFFTINSANLYDDLLKKSKEARRLGFSQITIFMVLDKGINFEDQEFSNSMIMEFDIKNVKTNMLFLRNLDYDKINYFINTNL